MGGSSARPDGRSTGQSAPTATEAEAAAGEDQDNDNDQQDGKHAERLPRFALRQTEPSIPLASVASPEAYSANNGAYTNTQANLVSAGLLHAVSTKFTIALVGATTTTAASYTLTGVAGGDCAGMTV